MFFERRVIKLILLMALVLCLSAAAGAWPVKRSRKVNQIPDTMSLRAPRMEMSGGRRMSLSAYPVQMFITGRAIRIQSDHNQILPIYTGSGALYMAMRLSKGTNWLSGLPRGRYFINNRPIVIN